MTSTTLRLGSTSPDLVGRWLPFILGTVAFGFLFWTPGAMLLVDWMGEADSAGLLLAPLAGYLAYRKGLRPERRSRPVAGAALLVGAVAMRYLSALAIEPFTMRLSMLGAAIGLVVWAWGWRQLVEWWLPATLLLLAIPLPALLVSTLALPLQLQASELGAAMLAWRHVPVSLQGNVILLPDRSLFVTEACSGLRSLSSLIALGLLIGGLWLRSIPGRAFLLLITIPVAILLNGVRIFLTGFLIYFVDPSLGEGLMHYTEGWILFVAALLIIGLIAVAIERAERAFARAA